jgi:hypothetical protein
MHDVPRNTAVSHNSGKWVSPVPETLQINLSVRKVLVMATHMLLLTAVPVANVLDRRQLNAAPRPTALHAGLGGVSS